MSRVIGMIPQFTAEASLPQTSDHYYLSYHMRYQSELKITPATYVDQNCLAGCLQDCGAICVGSGKAQCIAECGRDNADCRIGCTRSGSPPPPPSPPSPPPPDPCAPGTSCMGACCPRGFPACNSIGGTFWCCPSLAPVAHSFFGVLYCAPF
jgi:hypothetical protein